MRSSVLPGIALVFCAHTALAQGPTLGYVVDPQHRSIRPIWGVAGSAFYGNPLDLGGEVATAAISASPRVALFANGDGVFVVADGRGEPAAVQVNGVSGSPDLLAVARSGAFGAAYYANSRTLAIVGPLADPVPQVREMQVSQLPDAAAAALAVSDDGLSAVFVANSTDGTSSGAVVRVDVQSAEVRRLADVVNGSSVAFLPGGNDVVVSDRGGSVFLVRGIDGNPSRADLVSGDARLPTPSSVVVSADARSVLAASDDGSLAVLSLTGAGPVFLKCSCTPATPRRLNGKSAFLISDIHDGVAWMLDWDAANPRVLFIPPERQDQ